MTMQQETRVPIIRKEISPGATIEPVRWDFQIRVDFITQNGDRIPSKIKRRTRYKLKEAMSQLPMEITYLVAIYVDGVYKCNDFAQNKK
ncbi:hypothetical protein POF51_29510 [Brevibacillus sp. AG]|uniref:hypothetical protein n=1 Tax=Brevibacillus sp. AG TaxID=3020891 RepID=UPI0023301D4D|nr:hypothetical protein [Brevibacillus sp. AG]MDC0764862.1 hypothetical protein [Brevibacillus sp. AG]